MLQARFNPLEKYFKFGQIIKSGLEEKVENSKKKVKQCPKVWSCKNLGDTKLAPNM